MEFISRLIEAVQLKWYYFRLDLSRWIHPVKFPASLIRKRQERLLTLRTTIEELWQELEEDRTQNVPLRKVLRVPEPPTESPKIDRSFRV